MNSAELVRNACQVVWTDGDVDRMGEFYAEDFSADYPHANWGEGLEGAKRFARQIRDAFPDYREQIDELIDAGDHIIVRLTIRGTNSGDYGGIPATGKAVEFRDVTVCRVAGGKIVAQWGVSDNLSLLQQLGLVPV